jgi:hypothetical protein
LGISFAAVNAEFESLPEKNGYYRDNCYILNVYGDSGKENGAPGGQKFGPRAEISNIVVSVPKLERTNLRKRRNVGEARERDSEAKFMEERPSTTDISGRTVLEKVKLSKHKGQ